MSTICWNWMHCTYSLPLQSAENGLQLYFYLCCERYAELFDGELSWVVWFKELVSVWAFCVVRSHHSSHHLSLPLCVCLFATNRHIVGRVVCAFGFTFFYSFYNCFQYIFCHKGISFSVFVVVATVCVIIVVFVVFYSIHIHSRSVNVWCGNPFCEKEWLLVPLHECTNFGCMSKATTELSPCSQSCSQYFPIHHTIRRWHILTQHNMHMRYGLNESSATWFILIFIWVPFGAKYTLSFPVPWYMRIRACIICWFDTYI